MSFFDDALAGGENFRNGTVKDKNGFVIQFYHVPTLKKSQNGNSQATFKAFLTAFKDNFRVNWNQRETYGRMDPVQTFKNTQRSISISFDVPSKDLAEATFNFHELQKLIMMQYPVYEVIDTNAGSQESVPLQQKIKADIAAINMPPGSGRDVLLGQSLNEQLQSLRSSDTLNDKELIDEDLKNYCIMIAENKINNSIKTSNSHSRFMSSPPLLYIKFKNWISSNTNSKEEMIGDSLVGTVNEVNFSPDLEQGVHFNNNKIIPKTFTVDLVINVIHTAELGWVNDLENSGERIFGEDTSEGLSYFPYKIFKRQKLT